MSAFPYPLLPGPAGPDRSYGYFFGGWNVLTYGYSYDTLMAVKRGEALWMSGLASAVRLTR